jgi:hypothetical protein
MQKKVLYLHIGEHKTATTYIQKLLSKNYQHLKNSFEVLYPQTGRKNVGHHDFSWYLLGRGKYHQDRENFKIQNLFNEIDSENIKNVLISSEDFEFLNVEQIDVLRKKLDEKFYVIPILYLRNWLHAAFSRWQERVKGGFIDYPFSDFFCGPLQQLIQNQKN